MAGTAERMIGAHHGGLADDLRAIAGWPRPPYATSSAFRHVYDRSADRDIADTSAVAQQLGVLVRSVTEQPFGPLGGPEPGTVQSPSVFDENGNDPVIDALLATTTVAGVSRTEADLDPSGGLGAAPGSEGSGGGSPGPDSNGDAPLGTNGDAGAGPGRSRIDAIDGLPSAEALLSVPATVASRERAEQASRALTKGWYREAEKLFLAGTELTPTDPFVWFGAGLAASRVDPARAARHLGRSSRYLLIDDPAGAAYTAILAAGLSESAGDVRTARRLLRDRLEEFGAACPAISLHLARLGPDRNTRLAEAVQADPMLDADIHALGFVLSGDEVKKRRAQTEDELRLLDESIGELRRVDGQQEPPEAVPVEGIAGAEHLSLAEIEVVLWRKIRACENEIDLARRIVEGYEGARRTKEGELGVEAETAGADLSNRTAVPYFGLSLVIGAAVVMTFLAARTSASAVPILAGPIGLLAWLVQLALVAAAVVAFFKVWWPHRHYEDARWAKLRLPQLEWEASELREAEFMVRRRYGLARQAAELKIGRIIDRRAFVVPRRPDFVAADLPLVPARR